MSLPLSRKGRNPNGITFSSHKELTIKNKKGTQDDCGPFFFLLIRSCVRNDLAEDLERAIFGNIDRFVVGIV